MRSLFAGSLILAALIASCALPLAPQSSSEAKNSAARGTASLVISTPYGQARSAALAPVQTTVEPSNLAQAFDSFTIILDSPTVGQISKTIGAADLGSIRFDNLPEASDWTVEIRAFNAAKVQIGGFLWNKGGIATTKDKVTEWGQATISAIAGTGSSPVRIEIRELPTSFNQDEFSWDLVSLARDGTATELDSATSGKLIATWSGNSVVLATQNSSGHLSPGVYRLTLHFSKDQGDPAPVTPIFILNLYPSLTSTGSFSASLWANAPAAPAVALRSPVAAPSGLVLSWTPASSSVIGYDYVWYPFEASPPTAAALDPENLPSTARGGFLLADGDVSMLQPAWLVSSGAEYNADWARGEWRFYVRALSPEGNAGPWSTLDVNLKSLQFPIKVTQVTFRGGDLVGPLRLLKTAQADQGDGRFPSQPELAATGFDLEPLTTDRTIPLSPAWVIYPSEVLTLRNQEESIDVDLSALDRSRPRLEYVLNLYEAYQEIPDFPSKHILVAYDQPLETLSGRIGELKRLSDTQAQAFLPPGQFPLPKGFDDVSPEIGSFAWDPVRQRDVSTSESGDPITVNTPKTLSELIVNDKFMVRPVYKKAGLDVAGPWILMKQIEATQYPASILTGGYGRISHVQLAVGGGWLATGYAGTKEEVFVTRLTPNGTRDEGFGDADPGLSYLRRGAMNPAVYFPNSLGLVQHKSTGAIVVSSSFYQGGIGKDEFRGFTSMGQVDFSFGSSGVYLRTNPDSDYDYNPIGRPVADAASAYFYQIEEDGGSPTQRGITQVSFNGSLSLTVFLTDYTLERLAYRSDGKLIAVADDGVVMAVNASNLTQDTTTFATATGGIANFAALPETPSWTGVVTDATKGSILVGHDGSMGYVARLLEDGTLDAAFNGGLGYASLPDRFPTDVALTPGGDIVIVGNSTANEVSGTSPFIQVLSANGTSADTGEALPIPRVRTVYWGAAARAVAVNPDGTILVGGAMKLDGQTDSKATLPTFWRVLP